MRRATAREKATPYSFPLPEFSKATRKLILQALDSLGTTAISEPGVLLDRLLQEFWKHFAPTTAQVKLSGVQFMWELLTGSRMTCRHSSAVLKVAARRARGTPRKKARVWSLEEAQKQCKMAPQETRKLFRMALALAARSGDLEGATHISADRTGWRVNLPLQKSRGATGQTVAQVPRDWCKEVGIWKELKELRPGQCLAKKEEVVRLQKHLKGRLNVFRRTAISLRLRLGHSPESIRQATMHRCNGTLYQYVGAPSCSGAKSK